MTSSMRPVLAIGVIVPAVATVVAVSDWRAAHAKEVIPWRADLAAAQAEAKQRQKPVFLYFTASWCGPCKEMKATTWSDNTVKEAMDRYVPVKVDVDANRALADQYGIKSVPMFFI